jgi:tetratricopeptide (TPR) repeat protein
MMIGQGGVVLDRGWGFVEAPWSWSEGALMASSRTRRVILAFAIIYATLTCTVLAQDKEIVFQTYQEAGRRAIGDARDYEEQGRKDLAQARYRDAEALFRMVVQDFLQRGVPQPSPDRSSYELTMMSFKKEEATCNRDLAYALFMQQRYDEAERILKETLAVREQYLGPKHRDVADSLDLLANLSFKKGNDRDAESYVRRSLRIWPFEHPRLPSSLELLAQIQEKQRKTLEAIALRQKALALRLRATDRNLPELAGSMEQLAKLLERTGRSDDASLWEARAKEIRSSMEQGAQPPMEPGAQPQP